MPEVEESYYDAAPEEKVAQPLSGVTRRDRTALLATNLVVFAVVQGGMLPKTIAAFGLEATELNRTALLILIHAALIYFAAAFSLYAWTDYRVWKLRVGFLKRKRQQPYADLLETNELEHTVQASLKDIEGIELLPPDKVLEIISKTAQESKARIEQLLNHAWSKHVTAFTVRMH